VASRRAACMVTRSIVLAVVHSTLACGRSIRLPRRLRTRVSAFSEVQPQAPAVGEAAARQSPMSVAPARMSFMTSTTDPTAEPTSATASPSRPSISLDSVVLDTDDPPRLAEFYTTLLGWQVVESEDDWITIADGSGARIAFQLALNHKPPTWPDNAIPQQFHLDLDVDDLEKAAAYAESIGARRAESGDHSPNFIVFLDPSGHPFCLCS
jgi:catechol 2,3-dioxygenase-like lactoylglutathione lyase family enzyme